MATKTGTRLAVDTGGTFTDLVVEDHHGRLALYKSPTTPADPVVGVLDVLEKAAKLRGITREELLGGAELFIHGTTRAINAVLTGATARTALLTTQGHPDILVFREGGRSDPFNFTRPFPEPYLPRELTFEVPGRIGSQGEEVEPLDEGAVLEIVAALRDRAVEAVAVCLLWSIMEPKHELRVGELLATHLRDVPYTLSHQLNPTVREYRRASSAAIDASLKPLMTSYLQSLDSRLRSAGFEGRLLMVTSSGGVLDADAISDAPIHSLNSGPSMAPVAGRYYAEADERAQTAVIADTGGTSYDVTLVRRGQIPQTRETWLGQKYFGHMTGFPSVDVKSIGAGGGSIAWVDEGGLLHVGPESASADPGPVCYGRGGTRPTVTDASLVLGYLDPEYFLGGDMRLWRDAAGEAIDREVGGPLGLSQMEAAAAILRLATEHMVHAIEDITINQGIDPRDAVLVGGGGAAGLNAVAIARRLGCKRVVIPETAAALSAVGALLSDLSTTFAKTFVTTTAGFDGEGVNSVLGELEEQCREFIERAGSGVVDSGIDLFAEARYPQQVWQLDVPLPSPRFTDDQEVGALAQAFHEAHSEVFAVNDPDSHIEVVAWHARARCRLRESAPFGTDADGGSADGEVRSVFFPDVGEVEARVVRFETMATGQELRGPAIVESSFTTVVIDPGASFERRPSGSLSVAAPALVGGSTANPIGALD